MKDDPVKLDNKTSLKTQNFLEILLFLWQDVEQAPNRAHLTQKMSASTSFSTFFWHLDKPGMAAR